MSNLLTADYCDNEGKKIVGEYTKKKNQKWMLTKIKTKMKQFFKTKQKMMKMEKRVTGKKGKMEEHII